MRQAEPLLNGWKYSYFFKPLLDHFKVSLRAPHTEPRSMPAPAHASSQRAAGKQRNLLCVCMKNPAPYKPDSGSSLGSQLSLVRAPLMHPAPPFLLPLYFVFRIKLFFAVCFTASADFYLGGRARKPLHPRVTPRPITDEYLVMRPWLSIFKASPVHFQR